MSSSKGRRNADAAKQNKNRSVSQFPVSFTEYNIALSQHNRDETLKRQEEDRRAIVKEDNRLKELNKYVPYVVSGRSTIPAIIERPPSKDKQIYRNLFPLESGTRASAVVSQTQSERPAWELPSNQKVFTNLFSLGEGDECEDNSTNVSDTTWLHRRQIGEESYHSPVTVEQEEEEDDGDKGEEEGYKAPLDLLEEPVDQPNFGEDKEGELNTQENSPFNAPLKLIETACTVDRSSIANDLLYIGFKHITKLEEAFDQLYIDLIKFMAKLDAAQPGDDTTNMLNDIFDELYTAYFEVSLRNTEFSVNGVRVFPPIGLSPVQYTKYRNYKLSLKSALSGRINQIKSMLNDIIRDKCAPDSASFTSDKLVFKAKHRDTYVVFKRFLWSKNYCITKLQSMSLACDPKKVLLNKEGKQYEKYKVSFCCLLNVVAVLTGI